MSVASKQIAALAATTPDLKGQDQPPLVLVIDADAAARAKAAADLAARGYRVAEAGDRTEGLQRVRAAAPDLVVLAISTQAAETYKTCAALRAEPGLARLPILAAADASDPEALARAINAGATDFLTTPIDAALFGFRVKQLLEAGAVERELREAKNRADEVFESMTLLSRTLEHQVEQRTKQLTATQDQLLAKERELRQAQKMDALGQLAGGVAHEFNNQLTVMSGFSRAARDAMDNPERVRECLSEIVAAVDRAAALTAQMLIFSRDQVLSPRPVNFGDTIEGMRAVLGSAVGRNADLILDIVDSEAVAKADPVQLSQALLNLVVNARDAMPHGGRLTISCAKSNLGPDTRISHFSGRVKPGRYVQLSVRDTGTGMDPATMERIFDPFFTTKEIGKGTGLGLSVVFGMVDQCGGMIDVESALGRGTTITLYFPATNEAVRCGQGCGPHPYRLGRGTILVVEDEPAVLDIVTITLRDAGFDVLPVHDGLEAIEVMREANADIDLFIADIVMPGLNGYDLATIFTQQCPGKPVLFMSGYAPELDDAQTHLFAASNYIRKPFTPQQFVERVHQTFDAHAHGAVED